MINFFIQKNTVPPMRACVFTRSRTRVPIEMRENDSFRLIFARRG